MYSSRAVISAVASLWTAGGNVICLSALRKTVSALTSDIKSLRWITSSSLAIVASIFSQSGVASATARKYGAPTVAAPLGVGVRHGSGCHALFV